MKNLLYTTYDSKAKLYSRPFGAQSDGQAIRSFGDISNDKEHPIGKHPEDYTLFKLGTFDDENCSFDLVPAPIALAKAIDFVK